tara:strand:- start:1375 stop:1836 length:462 start_codon:yes stop_codon:yes gene_type:complete
MSPYSAYKVARKYGYRSGLEDQLAEFLRKHKINFVYEKVKIEWEDLAYRTYTPDFILDNGIIIETKGRFTVADRRKHLCVKKQHPKLDIRFVFTNSKSKLQKGAKTSYASWCEKYGFKYCDRIVPEKWLKEKKKSIKYNSFIPFSGKKIERKK